MLGLADGEDRAPLAPYVPPEVPEEGASLEYGVEGSEALTFVAKTLTDRLATRLAGRAVAASRIELDLVLDVALLRSDADSPTRESAGEPDRIQRIAIDLPAPLSSASDLLAALRPKIERAVLRAPVLAAKLRAASLVHKPQAALSLFEPQPKAERALPRLVAELAADLGEGAVGRLSLGDTWVPEDRSRFVRLDVKARANAEPKSATERDTRQADAGAGACSRASPSPPASCRARPGAARHGEGHPSSVAPRGRRLVEASSRAKATKKGVDYVHAWVDEGSAWVEIDRATGQTRVCGWFD